MSFVTEPRITTERERALAQKMHDALIDVVKGYAEEEILAALIALLCDAIEHTGGNPREAAEACRNAIEANFLSAPPDGSTH
jgi:hypothetical protein